MAEFFEPSYLGGPEGSPVTPMQGVQRPGYETVLSGVGRVFGGLSEGLADLTQMKMQQAKEAQEAALQQANDSTVAEFIKKQMSITQALETGQIKNSAQARTLMRETLTRYVSNNPSLATDLGNAHKLFTKQSGLGESVYEGTQEEKMWAAVEQDALKNGWITPSMSAEERQNASVAYTQFKRSQEMLSAEQQRLAYATAQVGYGTAQINQQKAAVGLQNAKYDLANKQAKQASQVMVGQMASTYNVKLANQMQDILGRYERGEIDAQQATMAMDQGFVEVDAFIRQQGDQAGADYVNNMVAPMRSQLENYKRYVSGEINKTALENKNATLVGLQVNNALGDPEIARLSAVSKILPNSSLVTSIDANSSAYRFVRQNMDPSTKPADIFPDYEKDKQGVGEYFQILKDGMGSSISGAADDVDGLNNELNSNMVNILNGIEVYGANNAKASDFNEVIKFLADPKVGKYLAQQGGIPADASIRAKQTLEYYYMNQVLPVIKKEYEGAKTGGELTFVGAGRTQRPKIEGQEDVSKLIKPVFTGAGVSFTAAPDASPYTKQKAKELNKTVAPIVNNLTYMSAHLEGNQDYKTYYEQYFAPLFEAQNENTQQGNNQAE